MEGTQSVGDVLVNGQPDGAGAPEGGHRVAQRQALMTVLVVGPPSKRYPPPPTLSNARHGAKKMRSSTPWALDTPNFSHAV
jgi:hypothetical protein